MEVKMKKKIFFKANVYFIHKSAFSYKNRPLAVSEDGKILNIWVASPIGEIASVVNL